jgi:hypothetical protein
MNRKSYWSISALIISALIFSTLTFLTSCSSSSSSNTTTPPPPTVTIAATSGGNQSATVGTAFTNVLVATVTTGGTPTSGVTVTFTAPASGASGAFATSTPGVTDTETTNSSGVATSQIFTANSTAGTYAVTASVSGASTPASFSLTNTAVVVVTSSNYSFYLTGQELINGGPNFVVLAGAVTIDSNGNVVGGVQDYNDAFGITSPQPSGDTITGGALTVDGTTGQGTLTLITNNPNVGVASAGTGTETFAVQFVNTNHALIVQYDGTAASSGSLDLQTLPSTLSGGFAFATSGVDSQYNPTATAGVFTVTGTAVAGVTDDNDNGTVSTNQAFTGTLSTPDPTFGRGTLTITGSSNLINYYIVGPEVIRIIDVDTAQASVGSAFGQGAGAFTNASLGSTVLVMANNPFSGQNGEVGQFSTTGTSSNPANFAGIGEANEVGNEVTAGPASAILGTYTIAANGYGSLTITSGLGSANTEGTYMTDPTLNLNDPNNTTGGGGALVLSLDPILAGTTGMLIPQTDTTAANFNGNYAVGMQEFNNFTKCALCEFDVVAQGSVTAGALSLTGDVSDPFLTLGGGGTGLYTTATFASTPLADGSRPGRYSMLSTNTPANPLAATVGSASGTFDVVMYQASGGQLFWLEFDDNAVWVGPLEQQGSLTGLPLARKAPKTQAKRKP